MVHDSTFGNAVRMSSNIAKKNIFLDNHPSQVHFLMNDRCNARCIMCGGDYHASSSGRKISLEKFKKMAANLELEFSSGVVLAGAGDPLLNKDLRAIIEFLNSEYPHLAVSITTNGIALTRSLSEKLLEHRIHTVNISINSASRGTYMRVMQVDAFETVCRNARDLIKIRNSNGITIPILQLSSAINRLNIEEVPQLVDLAHDIGAESVNLMYCRFYPESIRHLNVTKEHDRLLDEHSLFHHQELSDRMVMAGRDLARDHGIKFSHEPLFADKASATMCTWPYSQIMVGFNGEIYPCGGAEIHFKEKVEQGVYDFGNALEQPIEAFWNNRNYRDLRTSSRNSAPPVIPECKNCANMMSPNDRRCHIMEWDEAELTLEGENLFAYNEQELATAKFEAALAVNPNYAQALNNLGVIALENGDARKAHELFLKAFANDPGDRDICINLGQVLVTLGYMKEARDIWQTFLDSHELDTELRRLIAALDLKTTGHPPLVSVIVPTYNRPDFLPETLQSIINQTYRAIEIIVVNDCGTDVEDIVNRYNSSNNLIYIRHDHNQGLAAARNTGIHAARGKYIAYLDDDDIFLSHHIETLVTFLEDSEYKVAYTDAYRRHLENVDGRVTISHKDIPYSYDFDYDRILTENFVPVLCFMHEKSCVEEVGLFDPLLKRYEDWDLWIRLSRRYKFAHLPEITCEFSWHEGRESSMTSGGKGPWAWAALNMLYKYKMYFQYDRTLIKKYTDIIHWALGILRDELYGMLSDESHPGTIQELFSQTVDQSILRIEYLLNYYSDFKKDFYELLALLSLHKPDLHKAVESWKSAMEIEPHSQPLLLLGELLKKAMTEGSARPAASDLPNCHPAPGNDTRDVKEHACLDASRDIPATKPDDPATLHQYAISLFQQGRIGESVQKMERALELDPLNAEFHNDIGVIYHASGNSEKALSHFEKALEINPEDLDARKNLEEIRMRNRGCGQTADIGQTVQEGHKPSASPDIHVCNAELRRKSELRDMHAFGCPAVGTTQDVAVDWTQAFDYQTLTDEEIDEYSHIEVTEDLREGGIHAQKAWAYWFEYLGARFLKTSLSTEIVSFCNTIEHPRILSLGCGYGGIELNIAGLLDKPFHITAVDLNGQLFSRARQEAKSHGFDVNFMDLDLNYVFIPENSFDLIFAHASLHHLLNLEHVFHQIHRGLKDHGRLIVQDIIGKTQVLFWKENVDRAIEVVAQMPAQYKKGIPDQQAIIAPYAEPAMQKGMEGIRQEEIPTLLESFFTPVKSFRYGAFMRLICTHPELGKRLDPDRPADREYLEELFNLDLQLVAQNKLRPTEMLAVYEKSPSVDISGVQAQAHQRLGELLVRQGEAARAFEHFKRAAVIARGDNETPRDPAAERKPSASPEQEKMHAALQACHDIRAEHPGHVESRLALGQGFFSLEDPDEAGQHLRIASAQDPDNPRILHQHALLLFEQGHAEESIAHLARALEMEPRNAEMHNDIGAVYYACNEAATAQVHFEQALEIDPGDRIALKNLTELCIEQGRITHAREICARLRALDPEDEEADNMWSAIHKLRPETAPSVTPAADSANSVLKNKVQWSNYDWPEGGDEWSASWGSTGGLWQQTILPRIRRFLPARHVLEIAPGFGRCTQYLLTDCQRLSIVDLTEKCIKACRRRFKGHTHISFFVNDGRSLDMIGDNSIDFVFSWDSLVHVERDVMQAYLRGLAAKLKSGGIGFFHHSNIGAFQDPATGKLTVENLHWRGENMSAELFRTYCKDAGLRCLTQEIIAWGGDVLNDCMSVFAKDDGYEPEETVILENPHFMEEAAGLRNPPDMYEHFHPAAESGNLNGKEIQEPAENKKQGGTSLRSPCVLSIILSVKDTMKAAYRSIQSILRNIPRQGVELIVVDNGSHDGTRDYLSKLMHENVTVLLPEGENTLVQGGILGAGKASGKFLVFLDDSVVLSKSWMTCIMKTLENGSDWDAVVGKTISAKGTILEAGSTFPGKTGLESRGSATPIPDPAYNSACRVGSGSRHCMLIKKDIWNEVKPFNPGLENLGSALIDLGLTLASRGYRILYQPRCILIANRVDPLHPAATDALSPDPETLASLRPKDLSAEVMTAVNGSESSKVLVLGIYLANNLNTVSDSVSILSSSKNHAVEQKWVALNGSPPDEKVAGVTVKTLTGRVPKFEIINGLLSGEDLSRYDYVILCDDDVVLPDHFVDTFIAMQSCYGFAVAQPARTLNSYIDHPIVEQHVGVHARQTRFVEIGPVVSFHRSAFEFIFPFDLTSSMGWGYENVWAYEILHRDLKMGIVDAVCVDHSIRKPVANYDWKHADSERSAYLEKHDHLPMEECFQVVDAHIVAEESI